MNYGKCCFKTVTKYSTRSINIIFKVIKIIQLGKFCKRLIMSNIVFNKKKQKKLKMFLSFIKKFGVEKFSLSVNGHNQR